MVQLTFVVVFVNEIGCLLVPPVWLDVPEASNALGIVNKQAGCTAVTSPLKTDSILLLAPTLKSATFTLAFQHYSYSEKLFHYYYWQWCY